MEVRGGGIKEALERDGYAVVRDVFSPEEIARMRGEVTALLAANARSINGGLIVGPVALEADLARRLLDDARLAAAVEGEFPCQIHIHADTFNDWHADLEPPGWTAVFSGAPAWMYKIVIYLQDHPDRDGFSVVPGSHKEANTPRSPLHVSTRAGDIVVFDHSVRHAGRLPNRLIGALAWYLYRLRLLDTPGRLFRLQHLLQPAPPVQRLAIFLLFATLRDIGQRYAALRESPSWGGRPLRLKLASWFPPPSRGDCQKHTHNPIR